MAWSPRQAQGPHSPVPVCNGFAIMKAYGGKMRGHSACLAEGRQWSRSDEPYQVMK